ncbi:MAG: hypothetical protein ABEH83_01375 [Halobacterium sp.]
MHRDRLGALVRGDRGNAVLAWFVVGSVVVGTATRVLRGVPTVGRAPHDLVWLAFALALLALAVLPPVAFRHPRAMLPWEVLALAALPLFGRALAAPGLQSDLATYLAVAALALVVAVELDAFTAVRLANWFAVVFVVVATMAVAGFVALFGWWFDVGVEATFVLPADPPLTPAEVREAVEALVRDFVAATVSGVLGGVVFAAYFQRYTDARVRLPPELEGVFE